MTNIYRRQPVEVLSLGLYSVYCAVTLVGMSGSQWLLGPGIFGWPYPFLLTIQGLIPASGSFRVWSMALALGLIVVAVVAYAFGRAVRDEARRLRAAPILAVGAIAASLGGLTGLGYVTAKVMGWPIGE